MKNIEFNGQVAVVTGAGRALGRSYALELARRGAAVVVNDLGGQGNGGPSWADEVVAEIVAKGGKAVASADSVATPEGGKAIIDLAVKTFGTVDIVINNAGFLRPGMFEDMTVQQLQDIMNVHLLGAFYVTQPAWKIMKAKKYGRVVLTSSSSVFGFEGGANYGAAKAGLLGLGRSLAMEGASHGIKVNCILPFAISKINVENPIPTADSARNRAALDAMAPRRAPESVAPLVAYLVSKECNVSGEAYSALAGRYSKVFFGLGEGWVGTGTAATSAEDVAQHFATIDGIDDFSVPSSMSDEIQSVLKHLKQSGSL